MRLMKPQMKCSCRTEACPLPLQPLPFAIRTNKGTSALGSLIESFLSQGMIDFHLNENREAIMRRMNETEALLVFSQSYPTLYLIREILSLPHTQHLTASV